MNRKVFHIASIIIPVTAIVLAGDVSAATDLPDLPVGKVYYVDSQAGSDNHDGLSAERPWKSLDAVNRVTFQPGDTLLFKAGTSYQGQLKPQGSGDPQHPIRIDAYDLKEPVGSFRGLPRIDADGKTDSALLLYNVQGWEVRNLELTNTGPDRKPRRSGAAVRIRDFGTAKHILLSGLYVHDVNGSLVKQQGGGQGILLSNEGRQVQSRFDGLTIENCLIRRCERNGIIQHGYSSRSQWYPNLNVRIRGNRLEEIPGDGIVPIGCDGAIVEYNRMRDCTRLLPEGEAAAGIWPWACDNTVIQFNEVSDHKAPWDGQGFDSDWNCQNTLIQYNFSHDNEGGFLLVCNNGQSQMPYSIGNIGTVVRYNVSVNDGIRTQRTHVGVFSPTFHISGPCKDTKIYNNTIIITRKPEGDVDKTILKMDNWGGPWPEQTWFANNIFYVQDRAGYQFGKDIKTVFVNNLYFGNQDNRPPDEKAIVAEPCFESSDFLAVPERAGIDPEKGFKEDPYLAKLRLKQGSPGAGQGKQIPDNGGRDILGKAISDKACSVGAKE
ncbi:MAG TPA: right-handed parallel beta-helix repeat-containing protein [Anaerohalosphaeraceae bacterium]|nr:right-handed parallel beta-helix repeat-containing protein [Anaerohalosphaeraceae bacterium]